jgi:hypothetical protein
MLSAMIAFMVSISAAWLAADAFTAKRHPWQTWRGATFFLFRMAGGFAIQTISIALTPRWVVEPRHH